MADRPQRKKNDGAHANQDHGNNANSTQENKNNESSSSSSHNQHPLLPPTIPIPAGFFATFPPVPPTPASPTSTSDFTPPPIPADIDDPTPEEDQAISDWLRRNMSYVTTVPWHRYTAPPVLSPLWGYTSAAHMADCLESLIFYTVAAGRRLTDAERDSVLEHITRTSVAASYERPIALGAAAWLMARSWNKSRPPPKHSATSSTVYHAAAPAYAHHAHMHPTPTGTLGADGHITHFSGPAQQQQQQQHHQQPSYYGGASSRSSGGQVLGTLLRRVARTSFVGLSCLVGYHALWTPWRYLLGQYEVDAIRHDFRLEAMCVDMDNTMNHRGARDDE